MKPFARLFVIVLLAAAPASFAQSLSGDLEAFLDRVAQRTGSYSVYKNWRASAVQKITHMDRNWIPEKVTVVSKNVRVVDGERDEEILKAEETVKGKTRDITAKHADRARKDREKARRRAEEEKEGRDGREGGRRRMSLDDILPFDLDRRALYEFRRGADARINGAVVAVIEARSRVPDPNNWDGTYFIDPAAFDVLRVEAWPSKNPAMVKELRMRADLEVLRGRYPVMKKSKFKINGGILIKHIRMVVEEEYSNLEILD